MYINILNGTFLPFKISFVLGAGYLARLDSCWLVQQYRRILLWMAVVHELFQWSRVSFPVWKLCPLMKDQSLHRITF